MTREIVLPAKNVSEELAIVFPFQDQMQFGEAILGSFVEVSVFTGTDPTPASILSGVSSTINTFNVQQIIVDGLPGVIYQLVCVVSCSLGTVYSKSAKLAVVSVDGLF